MSEFPVSRGGGIRPPEVARLLMQHRSALYGFIFACVRNHADAEDILQTVSVAATESFGQLQNEAGFLPWTREIARRRILAHRRSGQREIACDPEVVQALAEAAERVEQELPASAHCAALMACLDALPGTSRRLITRRYEGTAGNIATLAAEFGRSVQSIYAQLKRIKVALRECVGRRLAMEQS